MRATTLIATLALTGGIIGAGAMFVPAFAQNAATTTTTPANWMTMEQVQTRLESAGYHDFDKIERIAGLNINVVTTAKTDAEAKALLLMFGMPFRK